MGEQFIFLGFTYYCEHEKVEFIVRSSMTGEYFKTTIRITEGCDHHSGVIEGTTYSQGTDKSVLFDIVCVPKKKTLSKYMTIHDSLFEVHEGGDKYYPDNKIYVFSSNIIWLYDLVEKIEKSSTSEIINICNNIDDDIFPVLAREYNQVVSKLPVECQLKCI